MNAIPENLLIRPFLEKDEDPVIALWREAFPKDPPWNEPKQIIRRKREVQRDLFLVGEIDGAVVATVIAGYDGFRGWVYHLAVAPVQRRKGLGRAMMAEVEKRLHARGCPKINLQVRAWNGEVIAFYKRLGYKVEEHTSMGRLLD
jgi:ribosomal protein S18 acetylase RimI-like enzyme